MSSVAVDKLSPADKAQLACTYATLILHDEGIDIKADKIAKLVSAAGVNVEPYWPKLIAKSLEGRSVAEFFGAGGADSAPAATSATSAPVKEDKKTDAKDAGKDKKKEAKEAPKEVPKVEEEDVGMGGLFD